MKYLAMVLAFIAALTFWDTGQSTALARTALEKDGQTIIIKRSISRPNSRYWIIRNGREYKRNGNYDAAVRSYRRKGWVKAGTAAAAAKAKAAAAARAAAAAEAAERAKQEAAARAELERLQQAMQAAVTAYVEESDNRWVEISKSAFDEIAVVVADEIVSVPTIEVPLGTWVSAAWSGWQAGEAFAEGDVLEGLSIATEFMTITAASKAGDLTCGTGCGIAASMATKEALHYAELLGEYLGSEAYDYFAQ